MTRLSHSAFTRACDRKHTLAALRGFSCTKVTHNSGTIARLNCAAPKALVRLGENTPPLLRSQACGVSQIGPLTKRVFRGLA